MLLICSLKKLDEPGIALRFDRLRLQRVFVLICTVITAGALVLTLLSPVKFG